MNSVPKNASRERTATSISTNTMPKAMMRSLAASLLMSQGMLCNVTEPETLSDGRDTPKGRVKEEAPLRVKDVDGLSDGSPWVGRAHRGCDHANGA